MEMINCPGRNSEVVIAEGWDQLLLLLFFPFLFFCCSVSDVSAIAEEQITVIIPQLSDKRNEKRDPRELECTGEMAEKKDSIKSPHQIFNELLDSPLSCTDMDLVLLNISKKKRIELTDHHSNPRVATDGT